MNIRLTSLAILALVLCSPTTAQENQNSSPISITLANDSAKEKAKEQQIRRIVTRYSLKPLWLTTI